MVAYIETFDVNGIGTGLQIAYGPKGPVFRFASEIMAGLILKYHSSTPDSRVFENLSTQLESLTVASGCTGTAACLVFRFFCWEGLWG